MAQGKYFIHINLTDSMSLKRSKKDVAKKMNTLRKHDALMRKVKRYLELNYIRPMMAELRREPPERKYPYDYPIEYVSEKQRRYVMWLLNGKPYQRTHKTTKGWRYDIQVRDSKLVVEIKNKHEWTAYVTGLVGLGKSRRSIKRYLEPMQPFHQKTGWKPAYRTVQKHMSDIKEAGNNYMSMLYKKYM